ncbi:hypothetical protein LXL04_020392 [Taraxacum kok-saghyz]
MYHSFILSNQNTLLHPKPNSLPKAASCSATTTITSRPPSSASVSITSAHTAHSPLSNQGRNHFILLDQPTTPLEHCEWLNKLLIEVWPSFISPRLSLKFSSIVEKRLKHQKTKLIERIELQEFSLGSLPPILGMHGAQLSTAGDQKEEV